MAERQKKPKSGCDHCRRSIYWIARHKTIHASKPELKLRRFIPAYEWMPAGRCMAFMARYYERFIEQENVPSGSAAGASLHGVVYDAQA